MKAKNLLGELSNQQFLDEYWEQKPLLIRQAFPDITPPFSAEELAGLCCDTDAPSRLIVEHGIDFDKNTLQQPWQVFNAPLEAEHFLKLPETHWTLLVNDLERYYPEHLELLANFDFIPDWRKDDLMVSYAVEGGNVGPHIDEYGVFLIQALGERHWQLDPSVNPENIIPDIELKLLAEFNSQQEWTLSPGDMLYLPPLLAHHGVAKNNCMTYSVGLRSPSQQELIESFLGILYEEGRTSSRYNDSVRKVQAHYGEISATDIEGLKRHLLNALKTNDALFIDWLGQYLTEKKNPELGEYVDDSSGYAADKKTTYYRCPSSQIAWIDHSDHITIFVNGESSSWPVSMKKNIQFICMSYQYADAELEKRLKDDSFKKLLGMLVEKKVILLDV